MSYHLGLVSFIPVHFSEKGYTTFDLWSHDLDAQLEFVKGITLFCPVIQNMPTNWNKPVLINKQIEIINFNSVKQKQLYKDINLCDVVQLPGNFSWWRSRKARKFLKIAKQIPRPIIVGISSNRSKSVILNASEGPFLNRAKALMHFISIRLSQIYLVTRADGVFVVGEGLRPLVDTWTKNLFVGTASWVRKADILSPKLEFDSSSIRLCVASRLERMKGCHLAIEALSFLSSLHKNTQFTLVIIGDGVEKMALRKLVQKEKLDESVHFLESVPYPDPFFTLLQQVNIVLLTNLNDEQPRLLFDAMSQGCLPICPDTNTYRLLDIPKCLLYKQGDPTSLSEIIYKLSQSPNLSTIWAQLKIVMQKRTIETMHYERAHWISNTVLGGC